MKTISKLALALLSLFSLSTLVAVGEPTEAQTKKAAKFFERRKEAAKKKKAKAAEAGVKPKKRKTLKERAKEGKERRQAKRNKRQEDRKDRRTKRKERSKGRRTDLKKQVKEDVKEFHEKGAKAPKKRRRFFGAPLAVSEYRQGHVENGTNHRIIVKAYDKDGNRIRRFRIEPNGTHRINRVFGRVHELKVEKQRFNSCKLEGGKEIPLSQNKDFNTIRYTTHGKGGAHLICTNAA